VNPAEEAGAPEGDAFDWYRRGQSLLAGGDAAAAALLLRRAVDAEPEVMAARELLARALFDAHDYPAAVEAFAVLVAHNPSNDYAQFGLGLAALRSGAAELAVHHLSLAVAMRPGNNHYSTALRAARVRATGSSLSDSGPKGPSQ
jgi:tetratricopeptide (TPR) repeat protein